MALRVPASCHRVAAPQRATYSSRCFARINRSPSQAKYSVNIPNTHQKVDRVSHPHLNIKFEIRNNRQENLQNRHVEEARPAKQKVDKMLSFEEFKKKSTIVSFEKFCQSPYVREIANGDVKEMKRAYNEYCQSRYKFYKQKLYGGNPATMT